MHEGFSLTELMQIGTRQHSQKIAMSATDINSKIPFEVAQAQMKRLSGFSDDELKLVGEHKAQLPNIQPCDLNNARVSSNPMLEKELEKLQSYLGIRTK